MGDSQSVLSKDIIEMVCFFSSTHQLLKHDASLTVMRTFLTLEQRTTRALCCVRKTATQMLHIRLCLGAITTETTTMTTTLAATMVAMTTTTTWTTTLTTVAKGREESEDLFHFFLFLEFSGRAHIRAR